MLYAIEKPQYIETITCESIHKFSTRIEAEVYAKSKNNYMVTKEQGKEIYYAMPAYDGIMVGDCYSNE